MCKLVFVFLRYANIQCNTYTGTRLRPTTGNGGPSKRWYVEHMRPAQLMNTYEVNQNIFEVRLMKLIIIHTERN